jgi:hypothetical protein
VRRRIPLLFLGPFLGPFLGIALTACASTADAPAAGESGSGPTDAPVGEFDQTDSTDDDPPSSNAASSNSAEVVVPTPSTAPPAPTAVPAVEAPEAIRFSAPLIGGGEIDLAGFAGRPVLLWFWSPF